MDPTKFGLRSLFLSLSIVVNRTRRSGEKAGNYFFTTFSPLLSQKNYLSFFNLFPIYLFWYNYLMDKKNIELVKQAGFQIIYGTVDTSGGEKHLIIFAKK